MLKKDSQMQSIVALLVSRGISGPDLVKVLYSSPRLLYFPAKHVSSVFRFLNNKLGFLGKVGFGV